MLDDLWYLADEAEQSAEQAFHRLTEAHDGYLEVTRRRRVSRQRFRTLANRIRETGAPYGAHTVVYRPTGDLLLVWHEHVDMWVLPGGMQHDGETFRQAARRELQEEAGVRGEYEGLGILTRVELTCDENATWGVMPVFAARADAQEPRAADPEGEISAARWFSDLPEDTRDRGDLLTWRERALEG